MKNSAAFETSPNSGGGQVHYMTSPDGNKQGSSGIIDENFLAEADAQTPNYSVWQLEYYQKFFNVSTNDVVGRIVGSMVPTFNQSFLLNRIRPNPDLYGPFWICTTLIFTISIAGNIYSYVSNFGSNSVWQTDFHKMTSSAFFVILYWWLLPTFIYLTMRWRALVADFEFIELLSVYGYSMFVFIPVSILWLVHISIVQWTLVIMAIALSGSVLIFTFWPIFSPDPNRKVGYFVMGVIILMHSLLAVGFMMYFFHSPDHFEPATTTTAKVTSAIGNQTTSG